ncbi:hypothetical protein NQZ68_017856 [Dissostichus eleginoides]|nr:hypothetical protein NQZ68_017856 [Dissostichus eleginoides]
MEAAVLSRSRAGGLFFLFTLLGLVCITTSLMDDNELEKCKREVQELEQKLEKRKAMQLSEEPSSGNSPSEAKIAKGSMSAGLATKAQGRGHRKESITHFEVRHQIIPFIHHQYRRSPFTHITAAMAAAVSSRSRGAAGGLFFLFTLLGLVCTAASLDENKLKNLKEKLQKAEQDLDTAKAQRDTASEIINGFMSLLDPTMAFMRKAAEGSPEFSALTEEYLKSTKGFMENVKSLIDGDNEELDAEISKWEQDLRASKKIVQSLEEYHAEL